MRNKINLLKIKYFIYISKYNILYKYIIYFIYINIKKIFLKEEIIFNYNIFMFKGCFARGNKITVVLCVCITNVRVQISFSPEIIYLEVDIIKRTSLHRKVKAIANCSG